MKIDTDVLGQELALYRNRKKDHLNAAASYESAAKDARSRAMACDGAIEAVQKLMGMALGAEEEKSDIPAGAPEPEALGEKGEKDAVADTKGPDDAGN